MKIVYSKNKLFQGLGKDCFERYLGIPYAKPPVGDLRFKAPQKIADYSNRPLLCIEYPANPIQQANIEVDEDCLYLNIWKPTKVKGPLPVMVWIYGGSFETGGIGKKGAGFGLTFDGAKLAEDTGCLIVTVNYRVNVFGFLDFSHLSSKFDRNNGLKDIVCALEWLNENISEFNGDNQNITLFGQSAGGALVAALSKVPTAQHLFHKIIIQSACLESFYTPKEAEQVTKNYLELLNKSTNQVDQLLELPAAELISVLKELEGSVRKEVLGITTFCPIIDGEFLLEFPFVGHYEMNKPMIIGSTKNEGRLFTRFSDEITKEKGARFFPYFKKESRDELLANYQDFPSMDENGQLITDIMYTIPKYWLADNYCQSNDVYVYQFDFYGGLFGLTSLKACHASDVPILFGVGTYFYFGKIRKAKKVGKEIRNYWGSFAKTGNPNTDQLKKWSKYDLNSRPILLVDEPLKEENDPDVIKRKIYAKYDRFFHESE